MTRAPKGVFDILPAHTLRDSAEAWKASELWNWVESEMREVARCFGYREIRTPLFERTELFERGVGEGSDIVSKEMYVFEDKGKRSMTLRPEGTAPVIRSFVEHKLQDSNPNLKLFYICPMFRYERPQAGRYRQHHQFGVEAIGNASPEQDAEVIDLLVTLYRRVGISDLEVQLNSLGGPESRKRFRQSLRDFLLPHRESLSEDSQRRFETNTLRILDSKDETDRKLLVGAPSILDCLSEEESQHFEAVQRLLDAVGIPYQINPQLVRGLDYYNGTVFEVTTSTGLGSQNSIGGGGRYDGLVPLLGGPDTPSMGFGTGIERVLQTVLAQGGPRQLHNGPFLYLVPLGETAQQRCFSLLHTLRSEGVSVEMDFTGRKLKKVMSHAHQLGARYVIVMGERELEEGRAEIKDMDSGEKEAVELSELAAFLKDRGVQV